MPVTLTSQGLNIDGKLVPVYSGTVHYWRLERAKWSDILDQVKVLGFQMIETYIPWSVHELAPGQYDWGQTDPRKDIDAFLALCEEKELYLLVRPGPLINAELTDFGYPEWVIMDPQVQARTALDTIQYDAAHGLHPPHQFPVPSYASEKFYAYVEGWFDAICPIMARHLAPNGCIVAVQSDNETCYLFLDQPYATDYAPDSLKLYRNMLHELYRSLENINAAYHAQHKSFEAIEPPRDCEVKTREDVPRHVDWVKYKEYQINYAVSRIGQIMKARGITGVPIFHDIAYQYETPLDITAMQAQPGVDWVGMNLYRNKEEYAEAAKRIRYLAGTTPLPFVPEFGAGLWSHHSKTFTPEEHEFITLTALMHGLKALNFYMIVERDRWQGSPITRHSTLRPAYAPFYQHLMKFLNEQRFWEFTKQRDTLVMLNYDLGRYNALASTLNYAHVDLLGLPAELFDTQLDLGFKWDPKVEMESRHGNWLDTVKQWLGTEHLAYDLGDTHLTHVKLSNYARVCVPATDFIDQRAQKELLAYAREGGHVLIGPGMPYLDAMLNECCLLADCLPTPGTVNIGKGKLVWSPTAQLHTALNEFFPRAEIGCNQAAVDLALHRRHGHALLFAANPTAHELNVTLSSEQPREYKSAWYATPSLPAGNSVWFQLPAYTVWVWEVSND